MAYEKTNWTSTTPINTTNLNKIEEGIKQNNDAITEVGNTVNEINNKFNYSTEEQMIGTWIDGKPLYRKVIQFTIGAKTEVILTDENIDTITKTDGWLGYSGGYHNLGAYGNANFYSLIQFNTSEKKLYVYSNGYDGNSGYAIVEYTKTTD